MGYLTGRIGRALLEQVETMFGLWHRVRDGTQSQADFQTALHPIQTRVGTLLHAGAALACDKTRHTGENTRRVKLEVALWTLRQQKRDVLDYLTVACAEAMRGDQAPSLLPDASIVRTGA